MHAKSDLRAVLKWMIYRSDSVITAVILLQKNMRLYRPVGLAELQLISASNWTEYPPRLEHQPIFYPVLNFKYAEAIAKNWNTKDDASGHCGFVTEFDINDEFVARYDVQTVGDRDDVELWVPAEELVDFNKAIDEPIIVTASYYGDRFDGDIDGTTQLPISLPTQPRNAG